MAKQIQTYHDAVESGQVVEPNRVLFTCEIDVSVGQEEDTLSELLADLGASNVRRHPYRKTAKGLHPAEHARKARTGQPRIPHITE